MLGNGDGTFQNQLTFPPAYFGSALLAADFNGDDKMDLAMVAANCTGTPCPLGIASVYLGNGDGSFQAAINSTVGVVPTSLVAADFNGDGKLDLAVANSDYNSGTNVSVLLGNGDGTLQAQVSYTTGLGPQAVQAADFNGDGRIDLATASTYGIDILLGNGDGTFQEYVEYSYPPFSQDTGKPRAGSTTVSASTGAIAVDDFNEDGKLDLLVLMNNKAILFLGNGDGTFQESSVVSTFPQSYVPSLVVGDFDLDGHQDLMIAGGDANAYLLRGNGNGTFQPPVGYLAGSIYVVSLIAGDFNGDGFLDFATADQDGATTPVVVNAAFRSVFPSALAFGSRGIGTTSPSQTITISNRSLPFTVTGATASAGFSATNNCSVKLTPGSNCTINVSFTPTTVGSQTGTLTLTDTTATGPQMIPLSGTGVVGPFLTMIPSSINFGGVTVGSSSLPVAVQLSNVGNAAASITSITVLGTNSDDFTETNTCGTSLSVGATCNVNVTFKPESGGARSATLSVSDNVARSPQTVALTGTGMALGLTVPTGGSSSVTVQPGGTATYTLAVGGACIAGTVTLTCSGAPASSTCTVPASMTIRATSASTFTVTVGTSARMAASYSGFQPYSWLWACGIFAALLFPATGRGRSLRSRYLRMVPLIFLLWLAGCGGGSSSGAGSSGSSPTPAGTYSLIIKAVSRSLAESQTLTLIVQ